MNKKDIIIVTGGAGFIGSHVVDELIGRGYERVYVIDKLTYASSADQLNPKAKLFKLDLANYAPLKNMLEDELVLGFKIGGVIHLAAESHVDNSINSSVPFVNSNIVGTFCLLEVLRTLNVSCPFVYVSTDEVFGSLHDPKDKPFRVNSRIAPRNPYSATKASGQLIAQAWKHTYGMDIRITNCSNNFGERQHEEKLIPKVIKNALEGKPIPIYGEGKERREWIHVTDHARGLVEVLENGTSGQVYLFGNDIEMSNRQMVDKLCHYLDVLAPRKRKQSYKKLITLVEQRKGHDFSYKIDYSLTTKRLGWKPSDKFEKQLKDTVKWYIKKFKEGAK